MAADPKMEEVKKPTGGNPDLLTVFSQIIDALNATICEVRRLRKAANANAAAEVVLAVRVVNGVPSLWELNVQGATPRKQIQTDSDLIEDEL